MEENRLKKIAAMYVLDEEKYFGCYSPYMLEYKGITINNYLQTFGISSEMHSQFIREVANLGGDYKKLIIELKMKPFKIDLCKDKPELFDLEKKLDTGDEISFSGFPYFEETKGGQYLVGFNPKLEMFKLSAEAEYEGHMQLCHRNLLGYKIIEGGFCKVHPLKKNIKLYGKSSSYNVIADKIGINLLERALPEWNIK